MATFIETLPKYTDDFGQQSFPMSPGSKMGDEYFDGYVNVEWFKTAFPKIATATIPLAQEHYESLKEIGDFWKINAINWRKNSVIAIDGIAPDKLIDEEEAFLLTMYPPVEETPEQGAETQEPEQTPEPQPTEGE